MDIWMTAVSNVFSLTTLLVLLIATILGIILGAIPGISSTVAVALAIPFTFSMDPAIGLILLVAIYCSSTYGGAIASILLNTPGTPGGAATTLDGYPLTRQGKSYKALGIATFSSSLGGIFSTIILITTAPLLAELSLHFGAAEYFAVAIFGISVVSSLTGINPIKGIMAGVFGILIATIGMDPINGFSRFSFDRPELMAGLAIIPVLIGLFSVSQAFELIREASETRKNENEIGKFQEKKLPTLKEYLKLLPNIFRSSLIGTGVGIIPGIGGDPASFIAYNEAIRWSKEPEKFGEGVYAGIAAPEASNNAVTGGALIPLLTLGIPGNVVTAILIGGLLIHGISPGPLLFVEHGDVVYSLFIALIITNIIFLIIGLSGIKYFSTILKVPAKILGPIILMLSAIGSYAIHNSYFDIWVMLIFGIIGYAFRKINVPLAPIVLGIILGPIAEVSFRQAMLQSGDQISFMFTRPITLIFLILAVISFITPFLRGKLNKRKV